MNITWDSDKYTADFGFVHRYGEDVLKLIDADKGSLVVDLGCGNGALTAALSEMGCDVVGIDSSAEMAAKARELHPELKFTVGDAVTFKLEKKADAVFSNAVFHWIDRDKQQQLAQNIADNLKNGGVLACEFGGRGCAETIHSALEEAFASRRLVYPRVFYFPTIGEYAPILENAGFKVEYAALFDRPTSLKGTSGIEDWINMFVKTPFDGMDENLKSEIIGEAAERARPILFRDGVWIIDYVRIRIRATKL